MVGCAGEAGGGRGDDATGDAAGDSAGVRPWREPPAAAELEIMESMPEQFAVTLRVQAPSGGYALRAVGFGGGAGAGADAERGEATAVRFELREPPADAAVTTAIEELDARIALGTEVRFPIRVWLRRAGEDRWFQVGGDLVR